ncbi:MBL fold metallo-hydrolase [Treponema primitia]|uniref:MBL fold metallo-hydrolase n=1 Tax=Treponema primitia TaxID=88058 RepID=UPI00398099A8
MKSTGLKIRFFNVGAGHELVLPNGKTILIDPYFTGLDFGGPTREDVKGADYILVSHTHYDHDIDLGYFVEKFNSKVFIGAYSATAALRYHKLPYDNVFPMYPGQNYHLDDFTLDIFQAKHNPTGGLKYSLENDITLKQLGISGHKECDENGYLDSYDFLISTNNGFRILMASGQAIWKNVFDIHPNILLRQAGVRKGGDLLTGEQVSPHILAELLTKYGAQMIFPFHQDVMYKRWGAEKLSEYFADVSREVAGLDPGAVFIYPTPWKWYNLGIYFDEE